MDLASHCPAGRVVAKHIGDYSARCSGRYSKAIASSEIQLSRGAVPGLLMRNATVEWISRICKYYRTGKRLCRRATGKVCCLAITWAMSSALAHEVHSMDAGLGMQEVVTLREHMNRSALATQKIVVALLFIFGAIALLPAAVRLYGVMSYAVSQSKRELGLRMALGAGASHVFRTVILNGLLRAVGGVVVGCVAALLLTRFIATGTLLYQVNPRSPMAFMVASLVMVTISVAACATPAWHAARTDPARALRE